MKSKLLSFILFNVLVIVGLNAQEIAYAYPAKDITIDGSFNDWPEAVNWYRMSHYFENDERSNEDFSASFATAYNEKEHVVYVAVCVLDDEFVGENGKNHTTQDHMLLYIDAAHDIRGGTPVYYVATDKVLEVHHKPGNFDTRNHFIKLENALVSRKRLKNTTQYEWKITLGDYVKANALLGLDFMLIDQDKENGNQTILMWKEGFGKSYGSQKLGNLMLLNDSAEMGKLEGKLEMEAMDVTDRVNSIDIVSKQNPDIWLKTKVDTTGYFQAFLAFGEYELRPNRHFTSPVYSSGFRQNTRRLEYANIKPFMISGEKTMLTEPVQLKVLPRPSVKKPAGEALPIEYVSQQEIDDFIKTWKDYFEIPAVSVVIIRNNKVFYDETMGIKSNITKEQVNNHTLFEAASITKSVFGIMVLRLAEKGVIDLDKPLYQYLTFPNIEKDERSNLLTARIILGHQSGLPNWAWGGPGTWENGGEIQLNFEPGTEFGYSGEAFNYLGRVIEHITGKNLQTIYEEEIEKPFGVKNSFFHYTDVQESRFAIGHMQQYPQIKEKERISSPASSLSTNAHLFSGFVLNMMNEKGLSKRSFDLIYTPHTLLKPEQKIYDPDIQQYVSHGFFVQTTPEGKLIAHGGNNGDYDSKFAYNPEKKFAYIVFTNSNLGDEFIRAFEEFLLHE